MIVLERCRARVFRCVIAELVARQFPARQRVGPVSRTSRTRGTRFESAAGYTRLVGARASWDELSPFFSPGRRWGLNSVLRAGRQMVTDVDSVFRAASAAQTSFRRAGVILPAGEGRLGSTLDMLARAACVLGHSVAGVVGLCVFPSVFSLTGGRAPTVMARSSRSARFLFPDLWRRRGFSALAARLGLRAGMPDRPVAPERPHSSRSGQDSCRYSAGRGSRGRALVAHAPMPLPSAVRR